MSTTYAVTIHLPHAVYLHVEDLARRRGVSVADLARDAVAEKAGPVTEPDLATAYDQLADDPEETDVERFFSAQTEILGG